MFLLYAGIGLAARSPWVLILALPLVIVLRYGEAILPIFVDRGTPLCAKAR